MVGVLSSNAVDRGFEPRTDQTKDHEIGMCCFSAKHAAFRRMRLTVNKKKYKKMYNRVNVILITQYYNNVT